MKELLDRLRLWIFIRVTLARKLKCPGWLDLSFADARSIAWAHWIFSCRDDCPMRRDDRPRNISFEIYRKRNEGRY